MTLIGFMLNFIDIVFVTRLYICHRKLFYAALMSIDYIPQVYKTDDVCFCTIQEQHTVTSPPLPFNYEQEGSAKRILTL